MAKAMNARKKLVVCVSGASGSLYAKRLLDQLQGHDVALVVSPTAKEIARHEGPFDFDSAVVYRYDVMDFNAPFASGSNRYDACVIVPCSMGTLGRIASGTAENLITRTADVFLKERRPLILVPRETPLSLIHLRNMETLTLAGALILPAMPSFYGNPASVTDLVDTVVARILDHLGVDNSLAVRWQSVQSLLERE